MTCKDPTRLAAWCAAIPGETLDERRSELLWKHLIEQLEQAVAAEVKEHVRGCQDCRAALENERLLAASKSAANLTFARCPSAEDVLLYLEQDGAVSPFRRMEIKRHLDICKLCREETAWADRRVVEKPTVARPSWLSWRWSWAAFAAAAALLLIVIYPSQFGARRYARYAQIPDVPYEAMTAEFAALYPQDLPRFQSAAQLISLGEYDEGSKALGELETLHAGDPTLAFFQGYIAVRQGQWEKAMLLCTKAEKRAMDGFRCWYLANVALKSGNLGLARKEIRHAKGHEQYRELAQRLEQVVD